MQCIMATEGMDDPPCCLRHRNATLVSLTGQRTTWRPSRPSYSNTHTNRATDRRNERCRDGWTVVWKTRRKDILQIYPSSTSSPNKHWPHRIRIGGVSALSDSSSQITVGKILIRLVFHLIPRRRIGL